MQPAWQRFNSLTLRLGIWCLLISSLLVTLIINTGFTVPSVATDLVSLLPPTEQDAGSAAAASRFARNFSNRVMFLVSATDRESARAAAAELDTALQESKGFSELLTYIDPKQWQQIARFYFPWRYGLLSSHLQTLATDALGDQLIQQTLNRLASPVNVVTPQQLLDDPPATASSLV